jgi:hypothetical protein
MDDKDFLNLCKELVDGYEDMHSDQTSDDEKWGEEHDENSCSDCIKIKNFRKILKEKNHA